MKYCLRSLNIELLAMSFLLYYLQREVTGVSVANVACDVISSAVAKLLTQQPSTFLAVTGDFNHGDFNHGCFNSWSTAPPERIKLWICFM